MIALVLNTFTKYVSLLFRILEGSVIRNQPGPFCERPVIEKFLEEGSFAFLAAEKLQVRFQLMSNTSHQGNSNSLTPPAQLNWQQLVKEEM